MMATTILQSSQEEESLERTVSKIEDEAQVQETETIIEPGTKNNLDEARCAQEIGAPIEDNVHEAQNVQEMEVAMEEAVENNFIEQQKVQATEATIKEIANYDEDEVQTRRDVEAAVEYMVENCVIEVERFDETGINAGMAEAEKNNVNIEDVEMVDNSCNYYYNWNSPPKLLCTAIKEYQPTSLCENFTKGCQWSPDGTCLLVSSEDFRNRIFELPRELYLGKVPNDPTFNFSAALTLKEGGVIYDTCWYPYMNSWEPATCCFLSTSKESPIHLWDAFNGELRATYRAYNQVDEVESSISIRFINSAKEVWAGFKNTLKIFDMERPGRQMKSIQFKQDFPNLTGLVSCIRENPIMPGLVAFGTYSKCIGLYKDAPLCTFQTGNGVTQIEFSPCGTKLFSAVRRSGEFLCWDLRNPGVVLYSFCGRQSDTNQRIQFDVTSDGNQLVSGGKDGKIKVWDLPESTISEEDLNVKCNFQLSRDCINGISLHRSLPIVATSSGQRLCDEALECRDNSVRLWWTS